MRRLLMVVLIAGCGGSSATRGTGAPLVLTLESDRGGETVDFSSFEGRFLVVHVFTTWSMPAQDDALRLATAFGSSKRVAVVGVALDKKGVIVVAPWRRGMSVTYPIGLATDRVRGGASPLGSTRAVPFTLLYDTAGRRLKRWNRPLGSAGVKEIQRLIAH